MLKIDSVLEILKIDIEILKNPDIKVVKSTEKLKSLQALYSVIQEKHKGEKIDFNLPIESGHAIVKKDKPLAYIVYKPQTPINIASAYASAEVVKFLLENGAKADAKAVHHAARNKNPDLENILTILQDAGVNINGLDKGHTPLFFARCNYDTATSVTLSKHHARMRFSEVITEPFVKAKDSLHRTKKIVDEILPIIAAHGGYR